MSESRHDNPGAEANIWGDVTPDEIAAAALHMAMISGEKMPDHVARALREQLESVASAAPGPRPGAGRLGHSHRVWRWTVPLAALVVLCLSAALFVVGQRLALRQEEMRELQARLAEAQTQIAENQELLRVARRSLAEATDRNVDLAEQLASAAADLDRAMLRIAQFEAPVNPVELQANRQKLLEVPGTVRLVWSPFDLPDQPAEQRGIEGDVVWNDELEQGYLRFVGLQVNDPAVEQYQVWVIDDRGMEQKVSGGVFNATAEGEVIVPIDPAIDVGRVALFAVTVEQPGGTWVPDFRRRVVVAPRG